MPALLPEPVDQFGRFFQHVDRLDAGGHIGHGHGAGKEEGPPALAQPLDDGAVARHQTADHAKGLAQRADLDMDAAVQAKVIDDAAPALAQHAFAVGVVHHEHDAMFLGDVADLVQRRDVAVHAEDAVGDDQAPAVFGRFGDLAAQIVDIVVGIAHHRGPAQAAAVDDGGVVEFVGEDHVVLAHQRRDGGEIGRRSRSGR